MEKISSPVQQEVLVGVHCGNVGDAVGEIVGIVGDMVGEVVGKKHSFMLLDPVKMFMGEVMTLPIQ